MADHKIRGASDLARETGLNVTAVRDRLNKGQTPDQIREVALAQSQRMSVQGRHKSAGTKPVSEASLKAGYIPARRREQMEVAPVVSVSVPVVETSDVNVKQPHPRASAGPTSMETYQQAELRKMIAAADDLQLKNEQRRGLMTPTVQVNAWFGGVIVRARDILIRIEDLGDKLAACDEAAECRRMIREEVVRALEGLRVIGGGVAGEEGDGEEAA